MKSLITITLLSVSSCFIGQIFPTGEYELIEYDNGFSNIRGYQEISGDQVAFKATPAKFPFKKQFVNVNFVDFAASIIDPIIIKIPDNDRYEGKSSSLLNNQTLSSKSDVLRYSSNTNYWYWLIK